MEDVRTVEPLNVCLRSLGIQPSSYHYANAHPWVSLSGKAKYKTLKVKIERIIRKNPGYGYRRIKTALSKKGVIVNTKPLRKLLKLWHLNHIRTVKHHQPSPLSQDIKKLGGKVNLVSHLNDIPPLKVLLTDFTRIVCEAGIFWLILFSDMGTKRIVGDNIDYNADTHSALKAYAKAKRYLKKMKIGLKKVVIHQDQGSVFTGYEYAGTLLSDGVNLSFTENGFKDNPFMESCNGHFKSEYSSQLQEAKTLRELKKTIRKCINNWNQERIHSALKGRSPDEFIHTLFEL